MLNSVLRSLAAAGAAALVLAAAPAFADSGCVKYAGLDHCPIGSAELQVSDGALQISETGSDGADGVTTTLPDSYDWQAGIQIAGGDSTPRVRLGAEAGDEEVSSALAVASDDGVHLSATFTGSDGPATYSILVYRDGKLVGSQGGVESAYYLNIDDWFDQYWDFWNLVGFQYRVANGACVWTFGFAESVSITLPDEVVVTGDEIHLVEEVGGSGQYPYVAFDGITLRSSRDLQIVSEEAH